MIEQIKDFLIKSIDSLSKNFPQISFTYGYDVICDQHLIEVEPDTEYRNEKYMLAEFEVVDTFMNLFPKEQLLFISNNNYIKIEKPIYIKDGLINVNNAVHLGSQTTINNNCIITAPFSFFDYSYISSIHNLIVEKPLEANKNNNISSTTPVNLGENNFAMAA